MPPRPKKLEDLSLRMAENVLHESGVVCAVVASWYVLPGRMRRISDVTGATVVKSQSVRLVGSATAWGFKKAPDASEKNGVASQIEAAFPGAQLTWMETDIGGRRRAGER